MCSLGVLIRQPISKKAGKVQHLEHDTSARQLGGLSQWFAFPGKAAPSFMAMTEPQTRHLEAGPKNNQFKVNVPSLSREGSQSGIPKLWKSPALADLFP